MCKSANIKKTCWNQPEGNCMSFKTNREWGIETFGPWFFFPTKCFLLWDEMNCRSCSVTCLNLSSYRMCVWQNPYCCKQPILTVELGNGSCSWIGWPVRLRQSKLKFLTNPTPYSLSTVARLNAHSVSPKPIDPHPGEEGKAICFNLLSFSCSGLCTTALNKPPGSEFWSQPRTMDLLFGSELIRFAFNVHSFLNAIASWLVPFHCRWHSTMILFLQHSLLSFASGNLSLMDCDQNREYPLYLLFFSSTMPVFGGGNDIWIAVVHMFFKTTLLANQLQP